ncbi:hypothetical protein JCM10450v2_005908 [Rhodotorula kratochvilovae]
MQRLGAPIRSDDAVDAPSPVLLLPALPRHFHSAPWIAETWVKHGEVHLRGFQVFAVEQRMTDRHALMPVIVVLTGDKNDCITVERFELRNANVLRAEERAERWNLTKAVLKQSGARVNETPQGHIPLTALPSLPPSLALVQLPPVPLYSPSSDPEAPTEAADYRYHEPLLIQNINLRRLGLGGRAGFRLPPAVSSSKHHSTSTGATPAQQLHFLQAYKLPVPPPSTSSSAPAGRTRDFTSTVIALGRTVQHALALFGLGPVKAYMAGSVLRAMEQQRAPGAPPLAREMVERALLEALLDGSAPAAHEGDRLNAPSGELELEDWAEALGLPLPSFTGAALGAGGVPPPEGPTLLDGDGLLCDTTVAALSVFRLAYAERFVPSLGRGPGAGLDDDGSLLPPALLAALLSLVVATRGKMVVLGAGAGAEGAGTLRRRHAHEREREEEKVPKDALGKRERFLRCVEAFQHAPSHSSSSHAHHHAHLPNARVRGALTSAFGGGGGRDSTPPSDADGPSASEDGGGTLSRRARAPRALHVPRPALHLPFSARPRGARGEEAETLDLEAFVRGWVLGEGEEGGGGRRRRRRRRRRGAGGGRAGRSVRGLWDPEEEEGENAEGERAREGDEGGREDAEETAPPTDAESVYTARSTRTSRSAAAAGPPLQPLSSASTAGTATGPVSFGRGVLRGVKERAGRAGRKLGEELGLGGADGAESSEGRRTSRDEADMREREGLMPPTVVVSLSALPSSSSSDPPSRAAALASRLATAFSPPSSLAPSPAPSRTPSPSLPSRRTLAPLQTDLPPTSAGASPTSAKARSPLGGLLASAEMRPSGSGAGSERAPSRRGGAPPMRRAVSEVHHRPFIGEAEGADVEGSMLFGGEGGRDAREEGWEEEEEKTPLAATAAAAAEGVTDDSEGSTSDGEGEEEVVFRPSRARAPPPPTLRRRHSVNLVQDAPEPMVWLSRRTLEVDVNLRATAWRLRMKEKKLEEMVAAMEAIHRSYKQAISSLEGPLARKTAELDALSSSASQLTARLEAYSASSSPLSLLSTGASRLQYAQAVLDDKLRDVLKFQRDLEAKIRPGGSVSDGSRELERAMGGMRRVVALVERWREWTQRKFGWAAQPVRSVGSAE